MSFNKKEKGFGNNSGGFQVQPMFMSSAAPPAAAVEEVVFYDTFTDADDVELTNHTPEIGVNWIDYRLIPTSDILIVFFNQSTPPTSTGGGAIAITTKPLAQNYNIECTLKVGSNDVNTSGPFIIWYENNENYVLAGYNSYLESFSFIVYEDGVSVSQTLLSGPIHAERAVIELLLEIRGDTAKIVNQGFEFSFVRPPSFIDRNGVGLRQRGLYPAALVDNYKITNLGD